LATATTALTPQPDADMIFIVEIITLQAEVIQVQDNTGNSKIVVFYHLGYDVYVSSIAVVDGIGVVIGGHSHTMLDDQKQLTFLGANTVEQPRSMPI
jgi:5'-nucleotidase